MLTPIITSVELATKATYDEALPPDTVRLPVKVQFTMNNGRGGMKRFVRRHSVTGELSFVYAGQTFEIKGMWMYKINAMWVG